MKLLRLLSLTLLTIAGCADNSFETARLDVDTVYINGTIWTGKDNPADASTLGIRDGVIVYVGSGDDVSMNARETIDLNGQFLMPGFIDNHVHFIDGGVGLASVDLRDAATPAMFTQRIADFAATLPSGEWVKSGNWDHELWGGELPHKEWIDAASPENPVFVNRLDGHMALANSLALELAGIDASTKAPAGGEIVRDANGQPTGILKDNAMNAVLAVIPEPTEAQQLETFRLAQEHALSVGLTQVHAVSAHADDKMHEVLQLAEQRGLQKIRINVHTPLERWQDAATRVTTRKNPPGLLRWGSVKGFVDGSLGSTTAWFHSPYDDAPENQGFALTPPQRLRSLMAGADAAGVKLAIHAIGDRAIDELLGAMETTAGAAISSRRYRIEHFQHPTFDAIQRAANHGVIASMQPYHAIDDGRWAEKRIGPERIRTTYAFRSIIDAGGTLTFGSDWPVAPLSPLLGVYAAVTRRTTDGAHPDGWQPQEKISVEEALHAYTAVNAFAAFENDVAGTLEVGKRADLVVLSEDPRTVDPIAIPELDVISTVIAGKTVYSR